MLLSSTSAAARPAVLVAEHLGKRYQTGEQEIIALQDVNLQILAGEFVVLLGPSGSGKSTLLNILGGLDRASSGRARFAEHDLSDADDAALTRYRREHVGFVFQFYNLMHGLASEGDGGERSRQRQHITVSLTRPCVLSEVRWTASAKEKGDSASLSPSIWWR